MKIETYRKGINLKHCCIAVACSALILVPIAINTTRAKYQTSQSVPLIRGTINFKPYDFKIMAMYQENDSGEYEEVEVMPSSGYVINEEDSYCYTVTQEERDDTAVLYTDSEGQHVVGNLKKSSKCYLWFDKSNFDTNASLAVNTILEGKTISTRSHITGIVETTNENIIYIAEDDDGISYYYSGAPMNNWISFGGFYWRIIRVNGDGSIRIIYNGTDTNTTGEGTQIGTSAYNSSYNDNAYFGFMYGTAGSSSYEATHANTNNSIIKNTLDKWYKDNLVNYAEYIDTNAGFCNDRQVAYIDNDNYGTSGYDQAATSYAPMARLYQKVAWLTTQLPTLKCTQINNDLFTMTNSNKGNKKLTNPVGLITSDEVVFAGGFGGTNNTSYYLYTGQRYWTMSPHGKQSGGWTNVFAINDNGGFHPSTVSGSYGIRPVINLRSDVTLIGSGSSTDPYRVS